MNLFYRCISMVALTFAVFGHCRAEDAIVSKKSIDSINAVELHLSNGMTVCIKQTNDEADAVYFKLAAMGGFASLDGKDRPSGEIAMQAAWESGMGGMTSDQVSVFLYEHSLEFEPSVKLFSRVIAAEGTSEGIESILQCVKMMFTQQQFTQAGWTEALKEAKTTLNKYAHDSEYVYETAYLKLNTQDLPLLRSISPEDLKYTDFETSKGFYRRCFSDPKEFVCVFVGNFNVDKVTALVEQYLGSIPKATQGSGLNRPMIAPFPSGITQSAIHLGDKKAGSVTRLTFPLKIGINEKSLLEIAFACQIIEARLRKVITEKMNLSYGVDVSYEFPLYPLLSNPWISIRYRCDAETTQPLKEIVVHELAHLQSQGVSIAEIQAIKKLESGSQDFWMRDNFYWMSMLTNYYFWGWNPELVDYKNTSMQQLTPEKIDRVLKELFSLSNYSMFTAN